MIRIIKGKFKNKSVKGSEKFFRENRIRPTANYTMQVILNILDNNPEVKMNLMGKVVCDVCAGSGGFGFEMLSSGAAKVYFIDSNKRALDNITATAVDFGVNDQIQTLISMTKIKDIKDEIDLIFIDPPYSEQERILANFMSIAGKSDCITDKTLVIAECGKNIEILIQRLGIQPVFIRNISDKTTIFAFFLKKNN
jgi:16S rRNA (guanine966-N2)-methyltransferase